VSKELDKLIEQVLAEKALPKPVDKVGAFPDLKKKMSVQKAIPGLPYNKNTSPENKTRANKIAKQLTGADGDEKDITQTDFKNTFAKRSQTDMPAIKLATQIARGTDDPALRKDIQGAMPQGGSVEKAADAKAKAQTPGEDVDIASFSFPRPLTNLKNVNHGKFLGSQNALINSVFTQPTFKGRIQELNKLGEDLLDTAKIANMKPRELLQKVQVADLFDMLFNLQDQRSAGYFFETFLALLSGGNVVGGGNGAADFKVGGGQLGSSKFYEDWSGIKQSTKNWPTGDSIHYVIGITEKSDRDETQAIEYMAVEMYYVVATNLGKKNKEENNLFVLTTGQDDNLEATVLIEDNGTLYISDIAKKDPFSIGTFRIIKGAGESYKEALGSYLEKDPKAAGAMALKAMKDFFSSLYKADENTKKYINSKGDTAKDQLKADAAFSEYDAADKHLVDLMNLIKPLAQPQYKQRAARQEGQESPLDQLIEAVAKQKLLK